MTIDFYYNPASAPCRAVHLAAKAIGVDLNLKKLIKSDGDTLTPEFLKINPQHLLPTIVDNGFSLWESRAIMTYLQDTYGKNDSLYPKDQKKRAIVDKMLYFDMGTLVARTFQCYNTSTLTTGKFDPEKIENLNKALELLDIFLKDSEFVAGDHLTLADLSIIANISNLEVVKHDMTPYKNINRWVSKVKQAVPGYEEANDLQYVREMYEKTWKK